MKKFGIVATVAALAVLATTGVAGAQMGVAAIWSGGGVVPIMALPIHVGDAMVIQPMAGFDWVADKGPNPGSAFMVGGSLEAQFGGEETKALFGGKVTVDITSPKVGDSYTDFHIGAFLGGTAKLSDNVSLVGQWGPTMTMVGKRSSNGESYATVSSDASITLRWWVFGNK